MEKKASPTKWEEMMVKSEKNAQHEKNGHSKVENEKNM